MADIKVPDLKVGKLKTNTLLILAGVVFAGLIIIILLFTLFGQPADDGVVPECTSAADCEGMQSAIACYPYSWSCVEGSCVANCSPSCKEKWSCGDWGECSNGTRVRDCVELNGCSTSLERPVEKEPCTEVPVDYCIGASDCDGKGLIHADCVGSWECVSNKCDWDCEIIPPITPPDTTGPIINLDFGESVEVNGIEFDLVKIEEYPRILSGYRNSINLQTATKTKTYLTAWVKVVNNSSETVNITASNFSGTDDLGNSYGLGTGIRYDALNSRAGRLAPGLTIAGTIIWEVPEAAKAFTVEFDFTNLNTDKEMLIWAIPESAVTPRECTGFDKVQYLAHYYNEARGEFQFAFKNNSGKVWKEYELVVDGNSSMAVFDQPRQFLQSFTDVIVYVPMDKAAIAVGKPFDLTLDYNVLLGDFFTENATCTYST
ncbi:MAG: DUF4352 domain-containing protein [Candidatus Diapherotrites archaeon]